LVVEFDEFLQGAEVDIIRGVDGLGGAEDAMGYGNTAAEDGGVLDVVYSAVVLVSGGEVPGEGSGETHSREDVWSMPMTFVMIAKLVSGTFSQALNAAISCLRMSFPG
jgi:hypothetical protein